MQVEQACLLVRVSYGYSQSHSSKEAGRAQCAVRGAHLHHLTRFLYYYYYYYLCLLATSRDTRTQSAWTHGDVRVCVYVC